MAQCKHWMNPSFCGLCNPSPKIYRPAVRARRVTPRKNRPVTVVASLPKTREVLPTPPPLKFTVSLEGPVRVRVVTIGNGDGVAVALATAGDLSGGSRICFPTGTGGWSGRKPVRKDQIIRVRNIGRNEDGKWHATFAEPVPLS